MANGRFASEHMVGTQIATSSIEMDEAGRPPVLPGTPCEVFRTFLKLGLTSFGGPIAHLGYFRDELVLRRRWIGEAGYTDVVALCQFLPGPSSSQVGFALGLLRAGPLGALAAWTAFTLPSALLLVLFAFCASALAGPVGSGLLHGLKVVAVAVVAQAVWGMARAHASGREQASIAVVAAMIVVFSTGSLEQIIAIAAGGFAGLRLCRKGPITTSAHFAFAISKPVGASSLAAFILLLFMLPAISATFALPGLALFDAFYRPGALVFGGGHVVLPLLEAEMARSGWVSKEVFLAGYGAAQAMPGPLFTFAAYLGVVVRGEPNGVAGAAVALGAIFLPGFLILVGTLPFWDAVRMRLAMQAYMRGANAAVVGILGAALYSPIWTSAIQTGPDFALALAEFVLLTVWKTPPGSSSCLRRWAERA